MKQQYDFHVRLQNINWSLIHIENLLNLSKKHKNPSFTLYAAFECRHILERIEFEQIVISANSRFSINDFEEIRARDGIRKANKKYNTLKFRYQTFTESLKEAVKPELVQNIYNFKESERLKNNLSQYLHIYTRTDEELKYESEFIREGFNNIQISIDFLNNYLNEDLNGRYFAAFDFFTLTEVMKKEFINWLNTTNQNNEKLTERLKEIVNKDN